MYSAKTNYIYFYISIFLYNVKPQAYITVTLEMRLRYAKFM